MKCTACGFQPAMVMWHPYIPVAAAAPLADDQAPMSDMNTAKFWICDGCGRSNDGNGNSFNKRLKEGQS